MRIKSTILLLLLPVFLICQDVINNCGMEGKTKIQRIKDLNKLKNRYNLPTAADINKDATLKAILAKGNDMNRWKTSDAAEVTGYVIGISKSGKETCNCNTSNPEFMDTHIELLLNPKYQDKTKRMIVEVTPRLRKIMKDQGVEWSTEALKKSILKKWVRVQGWLFFDAEHANAAMNTNPNGSNNWRATAYELHPVTNIEITSKPK